jgi:hypothetical protein
MLLPNGSALLPRALSSPAAGSLGSCLILPASHISANARARRQEAPVRRHRPCASRAARRAGSHRQARRSSSVTLSAPLRTRGPRAPRGQCATLVWRTPVEKSLARRSGKTTDPLFPEVSANGSALLPRARSSPAAGSVGSCLILPASRISATLRARRQQAPVRRHRPCASRAARCALSHRQAVRSSSLTLPAPLRTRGPRAPRGQLATLVWRTPCGKVARSALREND